MEVIESKREKRNRQAREWRKNNPERYAKLNHQNYEKHKETRLTYAREYRSRTTEERRLKRFAEKRANPAKFLLATSKMNAKKKGLQHTITIEDIVIPEICPILGIPLFVGDNIRCPNSPSLDRINSSKGYTKGNVQVISWRANDLKANASFEEIEALYYFMGERNERN